ncbi:hypothetical protein GZL_06625 [Streptomyces sp. 769]|nr:hypothetical protein GZL_06625 [Streptomyces sp. 769]
MLPRSRVVCLRLPERGVPAGVVPSRTPGGGDEVP